jgi:hypothetical protein
MLVGIKFNVMKTWSWVMNSNNLEKLLRIEMGLQLLTAEWLPLLNMGNSCFLPKCDKVASVDRIKNRATIIEEICLGNPWWLVYWHNNGFIVRKSAIINKTPWIPIERLNKGVCLTTIVVTIISESLRWRHLKPRISYTPVVTNHFSTVIIISAVNTSLSHIRPWYCTLWGGGGESLFQYAKVRFWNTSWHKQCCGDRMRVWRGWGAPKFSQYVKGDSVHRLLNVTPIRE